MSDLRNARNRSSRKLRALILKLSAQIDKLFQIMKTDECLQTPCKNGGTCIDLFGKYQCICPDHFEVRCSGYQPSIRRSVRSALCCPIRPLKGEMCDARVDECSMYAGTH